MSKMSLGCELQKISYLCTGINNAWFVDEPKVLVVNCKKFRIFAPA